jgi:hypothetical protein
VLFTAHFDTKIFLSGIQDTAEVIQSVIALEYTDISLDECQQIRQSARRGQYIAEGTKLFQ